MAKPPKKKSENTSASKKPVLAVGFAWYTASDYPALRKLMKDIPETFEQWQKAADEAVGTLEGKGASVVRVPLKPKAFSAWCKKNGFTPDSMARQRYAASAVTENLVRGKETTISKPKTGSVAQKSAKTTAKSTKTVKKDAKA